MKNIIKSIVFYFKLFSIIGLIGVIVALYFGNYIIIDWTFLRFYGSKIIKVYNSEREICLFWNVNYEKEIFEKKKIIKGILSEDILSVAKMWTVFALQEGGMKSLVKNISIGNNVCVIEIEIEDKKKLHESVVFEWNFFESFKKTIFITFPSIQEIYFYEKNDILMPKNFIYSAKKNYFVNKVINDDLFENSKKVNFFGLINKEKSGDLNSLVIWNFLQKEKLKNNNLNLFSSQINYEKEFIKKINSKAGENNCFLNIFFGENSYVSLIFYDLEKNKFYIEKEEILDSVFSIKKIIKVKNKDKIKEFCYKNSFEYLEFEIPSLAVLTTFGENLFVEVCIKNEEELSKISDLIELLF
jgi:hypothetical protein